MNNIAFLYKGINYQALDCGVFTKYLDYRKRARMFLIIKKKLFSKPIKEIYISCKKDITTGNLIKLFKRSLLWKK